MRKTISAILAILIAGPAVAQTGPGTIELTPTAPIALAAHSRTRKPDEEAELQDSGSFGLIFDYQMKNNTQVEVIYSQQRTDAVDFR